MAISGKAAKKISLREGFAPIRDRLLTMLFLAGLLHGVIILGLTFNASAGSGEHAPGMQVLLVSDELPEAESNDTAAYLAQRTQLGSGNTRESVPPRNRESMMPMPGQDGRPDGKTLAADGSSPGARDERMLTTTATHVQLQYLAEVGDEGARRDMPLLLEERQTDRPGPEDETGPAQLRGQHRDELWVTPDTRAATLAPYIDAWRRKVERIGTLNYPAAAIRAGVRASPVLEVGIAADGSLARAVIRRSSGFPDLDQAALEILKLASPFDPFPAELAREYRVLRFAYEWQFVGGRVESGVASVP